MIKIFTMVTLYVTACKIGYISEEGFPCRACEGDTYGRKCGEICACQEYQRFVNCNFKIFCEILSNANIASGW